MTRTAFPWPTIALAGALVFLLTQILDQTGVDRSGLLTLLVIAVSAAVAVRLQPPRC